MSRSWHHQSTSPAVIVWKVVGQHLSLNIIPNSFKSGTGRKNWCDRGMKSPLAHSLAWPLLRLLLGWGWGFNYGCQLCAKTKLIQGTRLFWQQKHSNQNQVTGFWEFWCWSFNAPTTFWLRRSSFGGHQLETVTTGLNQQRDACKFLARCSPFRALQVLMGEWCICVQVPSIFICWFWETFVYISLLTRSKFKLISRNDIYLRFDSYYAENTSH